MTAALHDDPRVPAEGRPATGEAGPRDTAPAAPRRRLLWTSWSGVVLAFYSAALLVIAMTFPWWRMESRAPQYGMRVLTIDVSPFGVAGEIKEIDGLGHYVGLRGLQTFAPFERGLAPYAVGIVALAALALPFVRRRPLRVALAALVAAVPLGFAADLWAWQRYAVTHLDPSAALNMIANRVDARLVGHYSVAQFHVDASFQVGFWLVCVAAANAIGFTIAEWRAGEERAPRKGPALAASVTALAAMLLCAPDARAATLDVGAGAPFASISQAVSAASPGDEIVVHAGVYREHVVVDRPLALRADGEAVIDGGETGTLLRVSAGPTTVRGFTLRGSGDSLLGEDAAIRVERAPGCVIEQNRITDTLFGILVLLSPGARVADNHVSGKDLVIPRRGDGIRVFASNKSVVEDNLVEDSRDLAVWNSNDVVARRNTVQNSRYGLHFMYCDDSRFEDNTFAHNQVGGAVMYSRRLVLRGNRFEASRGPSAYGLLVKAADDLTIEGNWLLDNTRGVYLADVFSATVVRGNVIGGNEVGISLEPAVGRVLFTENILVANRVQVEVTGTRREDANRWSLDGRGNYWSDYVGFDADGDGVGDVPYRLEQFFEDLTGRWPAVGLLRMGPASQALELAARAFPIGQPRMTVVDDHQLVRAPALAATPAAVSVHPSLVLAGAAIAVGAGALAARARRGFERGLA